MKLGSLLYVRCRHRSMKSVRAQPAVEQVISFPDGYNERVHRNKQHASSIRTIPSTNIAFIQVFCFDSSKSMQYRSMLFN